MTDKKPAKEGISIHVKKAEASNEKMSDKDNPRLITAVIPLRGGSDGKIDFNETLIRKCVESLVESKRINRVILSADDERFMKLESRFRNARTILRPERLSKPDVRVIEVLQYTLNQLELHGEEPDIVVPVEITYPFRPKGIFDKVLDMLIHSEYDTVIAGTAEFRVCWRKEGEIFRPITELSLPRAKRNHLFIGLPGLACALYPEIIRQGKRYGERLGILQVDDPMAAIEVRTSEQLKPLSETFYWPE